MDSVTVTPQASHEQPWIDAAGQSRLLTGHAARLPDGRIRVWTECDEAGVSDVDTQDDDDYDDAELTDLAREHVREIAGGLGTLAIRSADQHHYSQSGSQYQPQGYDRQGYAESYIPE